MRMAATRNANHKEFQPQNCTKHGVFLHTPYPPIHNFQIIFFRIQFFILRQHKLIVYQQYVIRLAVKIGNDRLYFLLSNWYDIYNLIFVRMGSNRTIYKTMVYGSAKRVIPNSNIKTL